MMNKKRKEHNSLTLAILTTITVVFTISPLSLAEGDRDNVPEYTIYCADDDPDKCHYYNPNGPGGNSFKVYTDKNGNELPEENGNKLPEESGATVVREKICDDTGDERHCFTAEITTDKHGFTDYVNLDEQEKREQAKREMEAKRESSKESSQEAPYQAAQTTRSNNTTYQKAIPGASLKNLPRSASQPQQATKWYEESMVIKGPEWYERGIANKELLQSTKNENRKVFIGVPTFVQCTENAIEPWDKLVGTTDETSTFKWRARFAKLYEDYIKSKASDGLYNDIDKKNADRVDDFIASSATTECIVSAEGTENGPYFINKNFSVATAHEPMTFEASEIKGESIGQEVWCESLSCAEMYLNMTDDKNTSFHSRMIIKENRKDARIQFSKVQEHMKQVAINAQIALDKGKALYEQLKTCEVYAASTKNFEHYDDAYYNQSNSKVSYDKKLTCYTQGVETQDFPKCSAGIVAYDSIFAARIVMDEAQKLDYMGHTMDAQSKMTQSIGGDVTAALKLQKESLKKQAQMQGQKAAAETAALAVLLGYRNSMPTKESLINDCANTAKDESFENLHQYYSEYTAKIINKLKSYDEKHYIVLVGEDKQGEFSDKKKFGNEECGKSGISFSAPYITFDSSLLQKEGTQLTYKKLDNPKELKDKTCESYILRGQNALIQNEEARDGMKQAAIQVGVQIAAYAGKASLLNKQAGKIGSAISQVDAFQPVGVSFDSGVASVTDCFKNPEAEGCKVNNDGTIDFYDGSIDLSGGGGAATISGGSGDDSSARESDSDTGANGDNINIPIGSVIASVNKAKGDFESSPAGALGMKKTGAGGGGGGGGGGAGSVAPPGGGSGSRGGGGGGSRYRGSKSKVSYSAGGGSLRYSSGSRGRKKSKSSNPFSKLFGKKKGKGGVMNFRGTASGKQISGENGNLFNMISQRYGDVTQKKRLQEYESVK